MNIDERVEVAIRNSSYVANSLKHKLLSGLLSLLWENNPTRKLQIYEGEVDDVGCDVVLTLGPVSRHVQLKGSHIGSTTTEIEVNVALASAQSGCIVWMFYDPMNLEIRSFRFFGAQPGQPLPDLSCFKVARRTTHTSKGERPLRPSIRCVTRGAFSKTDSFLEIAQLLFGGDLGL
jgi:hypothetical protein